MHALESEYSFLAPTWTLPPVATPSMYPRTYGTPYLSHEPDLGLDWISWKNTLYNSRYVPPTISRRDYSLPANQQRLPPPVIPAAQQQNYPMPTERPAKSRSFQYQQPTNVYNNNPNPQHSVNVTNNRHPNNQYQSQPYDPNTNQEITYSTHGQNNHHHPPPPPPPATQKRRVPIIDHPQQIPSAPVNDQPSARTSYNANHMHSSIPPTHSLDINQSYPKSKPSGSNSHREHVEENKFGYVRNPFNLHEYLYGLAAPDPGSYVDAFRHHQRRLQDEKSCRKYILSDYKNFAQNGGFGPAFGDKDYRAYKEKTNNEHRRKSYSKVVRETNQSRIGEQKRSQNQYGQQSHRTASVPKHQRAREYANTIEKPHSTKPVIKPEIPSKPPFIPPIFITPLSHTEHRSDLNTVQSANTNHLLSTEFDINQSRRSPSVPFVPVEKRHVRFHSHHFVRRRSSTFIEVPSRSHESNIPRGPESSSNRSHTTKPTSYIPDEHDHQQKKNYEHFQKSPNLSSQSRFNLQDKKLITPPSIMARKSARLSRATTEVVKPMVMTSTNKNFRKTTWNEDIKPQRSIPSLIRKSSTNTQPNLDFRMAPIHPTNDHDSFYK